MFEEEESAVGGVGACFGLFLEEGISWLSWACGEIGGGRGLVGFVPAIVCLRDAADAPLGAVDVTEPYTQMNQCPLKPMSPYTMYVQQSCACMYMSTCRISLHVIKFV